MAKNPIRLRMKELPKDRVSHIKEAFEFFDTEKKQYLDYYGLKSALRALGFPIKKAEALKIMTTYDKEREIEDKRIEYEDFYYIAADKMIRQDPVEDMKRAFQLFVDGKKDKNITYQDLRRVANIIGADVTDDEVRGMIDYFDSDKDGQIDEKDFLKIMLKDYDE